MPSRMQGKDMKFSNIVSESNPTLKTVRGLHRRQTREKEQLFLLEGIHCLIEAQKQRLELNAIVVSQTYLDEKAEELEGLLIVDHVLVVEDKLFADLVTTNSSCGVLAIAPMPKQERDNFSNWTPKVIAVADSVQDPGNLGTIIRSAFAAQLGGLLVLKGSVDVFNPKVVRAAAGAMFRLPIISDIDSDEALKLLKENKIRLVTCEANAEKRYFEADISDSVALVLGNEGQGVSSALKAAADESISIPMNPQSESLNVAISGGIILFESLRQRLEVSNR